MATVDHCSDRARRGRPSGSGGGGHHRQEHLAVVLAISPAPARPTGVIASLLTKARGLAAPRAQATSVRSTPRPPSSPAPLSLIAPPAPHDAA